MPGESTVPIDIPAGVSDGLDLRIAGAGHAGRAGGPPGDLYLSISVEPDPVFDRRGTDVFAVLDVPMTQAALGGEIEVETLDVMARVEIEPGTASGTTIRLGGKGIPNLGRRGRGDLFLTIAVATPRDLSKEQRRLLEEFDFVALRDRFREITQPTLLIWGGLDPVVPLSVGDTLSRTMACVRFFPLPKAFHRPHAEVPDTVVASLLRFIEQPACD